MAINVYEYKTDSGTTAGIFRRNPEGQNLTPAKAGWTVYAGDSPLASIRLRTNTRGAGLSPRRAVVKVGDKSQNVIIGTRAAFDALKVGTDGVTLLVGEVQN